MSTLEIVELEPAPPDDRELLQRFAKQRDEAAFQQVVARHGPLVWGVCRRILRQEQDVEDVFQATFLVLAQKAGLELWQGSVAGWLYKVAFRMALRVRSQQVQRRETELQAEVMIHDDAWEDIAQQEAEQTLHEEILQLPVAYRDPLVLCCLEGLPKLQAAQQLGCSEQTVKGRLQRGRQLLLKKLGLRGVTLGLALAAVQSSLQAAESVPPALFDQTAQACTQFAAGQLHHAALRPSSLQLAQGEIHMTSELTLLKGFGMKFGLTTAVWCGMMILVGGTVHLQSFGADPVPTAAHDLNVTVLPNVIPVAQADPVLVAQTDPNRPPTPAPSTEAKIQAVLDKPAHFEFVEVPLQDVIDFIGDQFDIPVVASPEVNKDELITANLKDISFRSALRLMLPAEMTYVLKDEVLLITTKKAALAEMTAKVYSVEKITGADAEEKDLTALADLISSVVAAESWKPNGGQGTVVPYRNSTLIISQSRPIHEEISLFLKDLEKTTTKTPR